MNTVVNTQRSDEYKEWRRHREVMNKRTLREVMNTNHEEHIEKWWIQIVKNTQRSDEYKNTQRSDEYKQWWTQSDNTNSEVMNTVVNTEW